MTQNPSSPDSFVSQSSARASARDSVFLQAELEVPETGVTLKVRVRNLSSGGFRAESDRAVPVGTPLHIHLPNIGMVQGRCVWSGDGKFGVAFEVPIVPEAARRKFDAAATPPVFKSFNPVEARLRLVTQKRPR